MKFSAHTIAGSARGTARGVPTINLSLDDVPESLEEGIYACFLQMEDQTFPGAMHYGPRPVHGDEPSCEVHVIDHVVEHVPGIVEIEIMKRLRGVQDFETDEELYEQIRRDINEARGILGV